MTYTQATKDTYADSWWSTCRSYTGDHEDTPCETLRLLAIPFAAHPDYDPSWRPAEVTA